MAEITVEIPEELASDKTFFEKRMREMLDFEIKKRKLIKLIDKVMEGAGQLSEGELVKLGDKIKEAGAKELRNKGIL